MDSIDLEKNYPSIELAYQASLKSYDQLLQRYEAVQSALDKMITLTVTISGAVVTYITQSHKGIQVDCAFLLAIIFLICSLGTAFYGKMKWAIKLPDPSKVYESQTHKPRWEFMKDMLYTAGRDFKDNNDMILRKWECQKSSLILFCAEIIFLSVWVFQV